MRLQVATAATVYQEPHFWRTEGFSFLLTEKIFSVESIATHDLIRNSVPELNFMGEAILMHAHSNYLICMAFIPYHFLGNVFHLSTVILHYK